MSNIVKISPTHLPKNVSDLSKSVFQANSAIMIKNVDDKNVVVKSIHQFINRCIADKGININADEIEYLKRSVTDDIMSEFQTLTIEDIGLCFKMGVRGDLGEYFGLNTVSFYGWLKKYKNEILPQTFNEVSKYLPKPKEEEHIDYIGLDFEKVNNICSAIELYNTKSIYEFNDYGNIHYNLLFKHGFLDGISENVIESIKEDSKNKYISDVKNKNYALFNQGRGIQSTDISRLIERIEYGDKDIESVIEIQFKKSLLKYFIVNFINLFDDINLFKDDLTKKINEEYEK
jgi:hypothetical protein